MRTGIPESAEKGRVHFEVCSADRWALIGGNILCALLLIALCVLCLLETPQGAREWVGWAGVTAAFLVGAVYVGYLSSFRRDSVDIDDLGITHTHGRDHKRTLPWGQISEIKATPFLGLTLREVGSGATMRLPRVFRDFGELVQGVHNHWCMAHPESCERTALPRTFTMKYGKPHALIQVAIFGLMYWVLGTCGLLGHVPVSALHALLVGFLLYLAVFLYSKSLMYELTVGEDGFEIRYYRGPSRKVAWGEVRGIAIHFGGVVVNLDKGRRMRIQRFGEGRMPIQRLAEGDFAVYHVMMTAWQCGNSPKCSGARHRR